LAGTNCIVSIEPGSPTLIVLSGEVNYETAPQISVAFNRLREAGENHFALDCGSVDFIDSSGIGAIVHSAHMLKSVGGRVSVRGATQQFVHALQVSGFAQLLDFEASAAVFPLGPWSCGTDAHVLQQASFSIPMKADMDGLVRRRVTEMAMTMPFTRDAIDDIRLAVGEAVSNAIRHAACNLDEARLTVRCIGDEEKIIIEIHNPGQPFDPDEVPEPNPILLKEGGMGIFFMRKSMDEVDYAFDDSGTTVAMTKYLGADDSHDDRRSHVDR
jgi:serine/threonine-protein kinase RsbW